MLRPWTAIFANMQNHRYKPADVHVASNWINTMSQASRSFPEELEFLLPLRHCGT